MGGNLPHNSVSDISCKGAYFTEDSITVSVYEVIKSKDNTIGLFYEGIFTTDLTLTTKCVLSLYLVGRPIVGSCFSDIFFFIVFQMIKKIVFFKHFPKKCICIMLQEI